MAEIINARALPPGQVCLVPSSENSTMRAAGRRLIDAAGRLPAGRHRSRGARTGDQQ